MGLTKAVEAGNTNINKFDIYSNYTNSPQSFRTRCVELKVYESIFDCTVRCEAQFIDAGYNGSGLSEMSASEAIYNMTAGEKAEIIISDAGGNKLTFTDDYHLRLREHRREQFTSPSTRYSTFYADFYSKESIDNHLLSTRATKKFDGVPSDHVIQLLQQNLQTPKAIQVDTCIIPYNFLGYNEKVFYHCYNLCNKGCVEDEGILAGFLFYEISKGTGSTGGYVYRSVDKLFQIPPKKRFIYNNTEKIPFGYNSKIINYYENTSVNIDRDLRTGSTTQRKLQTLNTYTSEWNETEFNYKSQEKRINNAGKEYYKLASDLNIQNQFTRFSTRLTDIGTLPEGVTWNDQKKHSKDPKGRGNYRIEDLIMQAEDRLNQLLGTLITILIPMDLSLHAGDIIECDFPEVSNKYNQQISKNRSGLYMIMDIAHRIAPNNAYTSIQLSRDSTIYRK